MAERARSRSPPKTRLTYRDFLPSHRAMLEGKTKTRLLGIVQEKGIDVNKSHSKQDLIWSILVNHVIEQLHPHEISLDQTLPVMEVKRLLTQRSNELLQEY